MNNAVKDGGEKLQGFAQVAGMSGQEFADTWKKDPYEAVTQFEKGLAAQNKQGKNVKAMLKELGITELRETDTVLRLANGNKQLTDARANANKGYKEGNALSNEAETKYKTLGNQIKIFMNHVRELGISIGEFLAPILIGMMKVLTPMVKALTNAPGPIKGLVVALALIPVVAVPVLASLAAITGSMGLMGQAMNTASAAAAGSSRSLKLYSIAMGLLTSPVKTGRGLLSSFGNALGNVGTKSGATSKALSGVPGVFWKTGNAAKGSGGLLKGLGSVFLGLLNPMNLIKGIMPVLGAGVRALGLAFRVLTGPIGIAVTIITTLYQAFKYAYNNVDWFREGVDGLVYTFKVFGGNLLKGVINGVKKLGDLFKWAGDHIKKDFVGGLKEGWKTLDDDDPLKRSANNFKKFMQIMGEAKKKATDTTDVLGKGVSKGTKKALGAYIKYSEDSTRILAQIKNKSGKLTDEMKNQLINSTKKAGQVAVAEIQKRNAKIAKELDNMLKDSKAFSEKEKQAIIKKNKEASDEKINKLKKLNKEIADLEKKQFSDGKLTAEERKLLQSKLDERNKLTIAALSKGAKEQRAILSRLNANKDALGTQEAVDVIKESIKAQDKAIAEAKKRRDKDITQVDDLFASGAINKKQHDKRVQEIMKAYEKEKKAADKKAKEVRTTIKKNNKDIEKDVDLSSGKVYTGAEKWWKAFTASLDGFQNWTVGIGKKANKFWSGLGSIIIESGKQEWNRIGSSTKGFGKMIVDGIMGFEKWTAGIREKANGFWSSFGSAMVQGAQNVGSWFVDIGGKMWSSIKTGWNNTITQTGDLWNSLTTKLSNSWSSVGGWFTQKGGQFWNSIKTGWSNAISATGDLWNSLTSKLGTTWQGISTWFTQKGSSLWSNIKTGWNNTISATGDLWNSLTSKLSATWGTISNWFLTKGASLWNSIKTGWSNTIATTGDLWNSLISKLEITWKNIVNWFVSKGSAMAKAVSTGWSATITVAVQVFNAVWNTVKWIWNGIWNTIKTIVLNIYNSIKYYWTLSVNITRTIFTNVWNVIKSVWGWISSTVVYWTKLIWLRIQSVWNWIANHTRNIFNSVWRFLKSVWTGIKNTVVYWTQQIWNRIKSVWQWIRDNSLNVFTSIWNTIKRIWSGIKGTIVYWTGQIWSRIKSVWKWVKDNTLGVFTSIWNTLKRIWSGIKGTIQYWTQQIWNRIKAAWNWIKSHTSSVFTSIWNTLKRIWNGIKGTVQYWTGQVWNRIKSIWNNIKKHITDMSQGAWNAVKDKFKGMYNSAKSWVDKIGKYLDDAKSWMKTKASKLGKSVANGAISGLNAMIGGINKISKAITDKQLISKIPTLSTGTYDGSTLPTNRNGGLRSATPAILNDKGPGNGRGSSGHQELIQRKDGSIDAPRGKNVLVGLNKGDSVINGRSTQLLQKRGYIPRLSKGTIPRFSKGSKKKNALDSLVDFGKNVVGGAKEKTGKAIEKAKATTHNVKQKVTGAMENVVDNIKDGASWLGDKIGDAWDYVENPSKLVSKVFDSLGINFGSGANATVEMAKAAYKKLKTLFVDKVKSMFEEYSGGDSGFLELNRGINFPFMASAAEAIRKGYPFPRAHHGIDINYPMGTPVRSTISGKAEGRSGYNGGFGNSVWIKSGIIDVIYGHLSKLAFKSKRVKPGDLLGYSGSTGDSTGPHLHYEMRWNGVAKDPMDWLRKHNGGGKGGGQNKAASAWSGDIRRAAKRMGVSVSNRDVSNIVSLIHHESGGNSSIVQSVQDINSAMGNPARGLLQYVPQTFRSYAVKGHNNINSGYDQLLAFFNNKYWRSQFNPMGGWSPSGPRRFAHGGMIKKHGLYEAGEGNRPEMVLPLTNKTRSMQLIEQAKSFMGIEDPVYEKEVKVDNGKTITGDTTHLEALLQESIQIQKQTAVILQALLESNVNLEAKELVVDENAMERLHNKNQDKRERQKERQSRFRGGLV